MYVFLCLHVCVDMHIPPYTRQDSGVCLSVLTSSLVLGRDLGHHSSSSHLVRKLRPERVKWLAQDHTAAKVAEMRLEPRISDS